jgi:hypothetical protein
MKGAVAAVSKGTAALFLSRDTRLPMLYFVKPVGFRVFPGESEDFG